MLDPGKILQDRYEIIRKIGEGGMGAVYLAKDRRLDSLVALKETLFKDENMLRAFEREARLLAGLRHSALTKVSDHFTEGGSQYLVMDFISGDDLWTVLEKRRERIPPQGEPKPFTQDEVLNWGDQLLDALDYLHSHKPPIIHRDIKPQNLKITERDNVILLDFGLAKGAASQTTPLAANKSVFGYTPTYAPIEQMQASGTDPRTDLYSLGATLYHLITGRTPPDALKRFAAVGSGQPDPLVAPSSLNPEVSHAVGQVLMWAMARNSSDRPESAAAMRQALRDARRGQVPSGAQRALTPPPSNYAATQVSYPQPPAPPPSNPYPSNSQPPNPYASNPHPSNPSNPYASNPSNPYQSNPHPSAPSSWPPSPANQMNTQPSWPQPSWPQPQAPATQQGYPHAQPAQKSSKALWIVICFLVVAVVAISIVLFASLNRRSNRRAELGGMNSARSSDTPSGSSIPGAPNANTAPGSTVGSKPDNSEAASSPSTDSRIDDTLTRYVDALGGESAIQNVTSRVSKGTLEMPDVGVTGTVEIYGKAPDKYAFIINIPSMGTIRNGYNGSVGWAQELNLDVRRLEGPELSAMKRDAEFYREIKLKELFPVMRFNGKQPVNGREANVITATASDGSSEKWYFDAQNGLLVRNDQSRQTQQGPSETDSYYEQYKPVDGINLPFRVRGSAGVVKMVIKLKEVVHDVAINDSIFNMPGN